MVTSVCGFVGSRAGADMAYAAAVRELGRELGRRRLGVIYGGGGAGLLGVLAEAALAAGAEVTGVIPQALADREVAHTGVSALEVVGSLHERKAAMAAHADAFIGAPGGIGTLEELIEVLSWRQLGLHDKPCGLLNINGYFDRLLAWFEHAVDEGFVATADRRLLAVATSPGDLLDRLGAGQESESS